MKNFGYRPLPQLVQITEENQSNHKSNFTGDSTDVQKHMRLRDV